MKIKQLYIIFPQIENEDLFIILKLLSFNEIDSNQY